MVVINGKKLVVCTPAGRRRYMELLEHHVLRSPMVDEWQLWQNTNDQEDIAWMNALAHREQRVTIRKPDWPCEGNWSIHKFFPACADPGSVYVRVDDDIVWCEQNAIVKLAHKRLKSPEPFLIHGYVINSGLTSHLYQRAGKVGLDCGHAGYGCMDPIGWGYGYFAVKLHRRFLENPFTVDWRMPDWLLHYHERHSINVISWTGEDAVRWAHEIGRDEEQWLSVERPKAEGRYNLIYGGALFSHLAFHTQRAFVDAATDILDGYKRLTNVF